MTASFGSVLLAIALGAGLLAPTASAQEIHSTHCLQGCPSGAPPTNDLIIREIYILSSNDDTKFADWAAYRVTKETISSSQNRNWKADPLLDDVETLEPDDYRGANAALGVDRGHQVPLASFTGTPHWRDTNLLSNITPQMGPLNQGPWQRLESKARELAQRPDVAAVYVVTGPLYERRMPSLPEADEPHRIPSGYWKVVALAGDTPRMAAFYFDQLTPRDADICDHLKTVDEIESRSRLDLLPELEEQAEEDLESGVAALAHYPGCTGSRGIHRT